MSESRGFEAMFDAAPFPVLVHRNGAVEYVNPAAVAHLGIAPAAEMVGRPVPATVMEAVSWPAGDAGPEYTVVRLRDGMPGETEERFRDLFEEAPVAYHEIDAQGIIRRVNRAECELLGFARDELIGQHVLLAEDNAVNRTGKDRRTKPRRASPEVGLQLFFNLLFLRDVEHRGADPDGPLQKVAVRMLERLGIRTDVASNGLEAVQMAQLAPYDMILMDCQMPEMDSYTAASEIRRSKGPGRRTVVVAMTAEAIAGAREQCLSAGMDDYLAKPVQLDALANVLRTWTVRAPQK